MAEVVAGKIYRRRRPERSVAYRALAYHFERFLQVYEDRFEPAFGYLRGVVEKAVYRYLDCGILEPGFAHLRCEGCGESAIVAFSCKQRCVCPPATRNESFCGPSGLLRSCSKTCPIAR